MPRVETVSSNVSFLKDVERRLAEADVPSASFEAEQLVRHFGRLTRIELYTGAKAIAPTGRRALEKALSRRLKGLPLHYVLKEADFYGHTFFVTRDTLIPRPETELLVEEARKHLDSRFRARPGSRSGPRVLEIGTGTGCVAVCLTIHRPDCRMTALDVSRKALKVARKNVEKYGLGRSIRLIHSDLFGHFGPRHRHFWDLIVSNPPYVGEDEFPGLSREVRSEPRLALDGGRGGLEVIDRILERAPYHLKNGGTLILEIGHGQAESIGRRLSADRRYKKFRFVKDFSGIDRILAVETV